MRTSPSEDEMLRRGGMLARFDEKRAHISGFGEMNKISEFKEGSE